jgi:hypothetical protein
MEEEGQHIVINVEPPPPPPIADIMEEEGQHIVINVASRPSEEKQDREERPFKEVLDPYESGLASRERKNFQKRETAKQTQLQGKRGQGIDPFPNLYADMPYVAEDFPQQDLSSTCVGEAGEAIDKLEEEMKIDFQKMIEGCDYIDEDL